jgi:SAM-dependent methyltransferase
LKKFILSDGLPSEAELRGLHLSAGAKHYRAYVGPPDRYDLMSALEFRILTELGMREYHNVLDLGCGSLRLGRLLIPFLLPHRYVGVEPESWLVDAGFEHELGETIRKIKDPEFCFDGECSLDHFGHSFDYIMIQSVFSHAPLDWIRRCAVRLSKVLAKPAGVVIANYLEGPSDYAGSQWLYPAVGAYRRKTLEDLFGAGGVVWRELNYPHPGGLTWFILSH